MIKNGKEKTESDFYIVSELCQNGELFDYVYKANGLSENICRQLFKQILDAVDAIHSEGIAHRDIKMENVLLTEDLRAQLCDFGFGNHMAFLEDQVLMTKSVTPDFLAPELHGGI